MASVEITIVEKFMEYGILGVMILALGFYIKTLQTTHNKERVELLKNHKSEREELRKFAKDDRDEAAKIASKQFTSLIEVTEKGTSVVSDLKATLETIERRINNN
jgi:biopolymer transport protein ExbB/TolQ